MAANMLTAYYSRGCDSKELFQELKIATHPDFEKHLNQYNVIHLNMQSFLSKTQTIEQMIALVTKAVGRDLLRAYPDIDYLDKTILTFMLDDVYQNYQVPFIFIIDEWDCIFRSRKNQLEEQTKYLDFLRDLLKDKGYIALAYMTGILPIKKYGEHSAINVFYEYSMTDASPIEEFTGFTEQEVRQLCEQYNMPFSETKKWYDGYCVDGVSIYNPKSVVEAMLRGKFSNYWTKTETYEALKVYIDLNQDGLRDKIVQMIAGETVPVNPDKFQNDMTTFYSADDVLTLLVHLGYLTYDEQNRVVWIPNGEVRQEFVNSIEDGGWEPVLQAIHSSEKLLQATLSGDEQTVAELIEQVHQANVSILKYNDENALSCVISLHTTLLKRTIPYIIFECAKVQFSMLFNQLNGNIRICLYFCFRQVLFRSEFLIVVQHTIMSKGKAPISMTIKRRLVLFSCLYGFICCKSCTADAEKPFKETL